MRRITMSGLCAALLVTGCAQTPLGPQVQVLPGRNKPFEAFRADDDNCRQYSSGQVAGQAENANNRAVGAAVLGTVLGAGLGAAIGGGRGAAIGAGGGALVGTSVGSNGSGYQQGGIQAQYDNAYTQCMVAHGNVLPGPRYVPVVVEPVYAPAYVPVYPRAPVGY